MLRFCFPITEMDPIHFIRSTPQILSVLQKNGIWLPFRRISFSGTAIPEKQNWSRKVTFFPMKNAWIPSSIKRATKAMIFMTACNIQVLLTGLFSVYWPYSVQETINRLQKKKCASLIPSVCTLMPFFIELSIFQPLPAYQQNQFALHLIRFAENIIWQAKSPQFFPCFFSIRTTMRLPNHSKLP